MGKNQKNKISLDNLNRELPFSVPENYFDNFYSRLQKRMEIEDKPGLFRRTYRLIRPQLALAAAIAAFIIIGYTTGRFFLKETGRTETTVDIADVIDFYIDDFDEDILVKTVAEKDISWRNANLEAVDILDYLSEENNIDDVELIELY